MKTMTTRERMARMLEHREADRVPITDSPWSSTVARWRREGMPEDVHWADYFGLDKFAGIGVDILNPIEVKAGMDPVALKRRYGKRLAFHGGINAVLYPQPEKLYAEMRAVIPEMKKGGGYVISTDHSVPDSVSLEDFRRFVDLAKELAVY